MGFFKFLCLLVFFFPLGFCFQAENVNFLVMLFPGYFPYVQETESPGARRSTEEKVLLLRDWDKWERALRTWVVRRPRQQARKSRASESLSVLC